MKQGIYSFWFCWISWWFSGSSTVVAFCVASLVKAPLNGVSGSSWRSGFRRRYWRRYIFNAVTFSLQYPLGFHFFVHNLKLFLCTSVVLNFNWIHCYWNFTIDGCLDCHFWHKARWEFNKETNRHFPLSFSLGSCTAFFVLLKEIKERVSKCIRVFMRHILEL